MELLGDIEQHMINGLLMPGYYTDKWNFFIVIRIHVTCGSTCFSWEVGSIYILSS
jgi:hypothetical protein